MRLAPDLVELTGRQVTGYDYLGAWADEVEEAEGILLGLQRAVRSGAYATTSESVLMELIRGKDHPSFKAISTILKETKDPDPLEPF